MVKIYPNYEPIPGYKTIEKIGEGGFGEVWKASAPGGLLKAIKFVNTSQGVHKAALEKQSIDRIKSIRHPFILSMERVDMNDGILMVVMELADKNLWGRYKEYKAKGLPGIPKTELIKYLFEAAEALDLIQSQYQLQHLDIKPHNLFLVQNHLKIGDFGLVRELTFNSNDYQGTITPVYSPPELIEGWPSKYSDQYSLAIVYQEMATGKRPFEADNLRKLIQMHLNEEPDLSSLPHLERPVLAKALSKIPEQRYASCQEFVEQLSACQEVNHQPKIEPTIQKTIPYPVEITRTTTSQQMEDLSRTINLKSQPALNQTKEIKPSEAEKSNNIDDQVRPSGVLLIGLGKTAVENIGLWNSQSKETKNANFPLVKIEPLGIDMDSLGIQTADPNKSLSPDQTIICTLNRPNYYLRDQEKLEKLKTWLPLNKLYQIPKDLSTGGSRALGRLALLDAREKVCQQLQNQISSIWNKESLLTFGQKMRPEITIMANISGGASGAIFDLISWIEEISSGEGLLTPNVTLLFLIPASTTVNPQDIENARANLLEIIFYCSKISEKKIRKVVLLNISNESDKSTAEFLNILFFNLLSETKDISQIETGKIQDHNYKFYSAGVKTLQLESLSPSGLRNESTAIKLIAFWNHWLPSKTRELQVQAEQELKNLKISPANLHEFLKEGLDQSLEMPADSFFLKELLESLYKIANVSSNQDVEKTSLDVLSKSKDFLGNYEETNVDSLNHGLFAKILHRRYLEKIEDLNKYVDSWIVKTIEQPGLRFGGAKELLKILAANFALHAKSCSQDENRNINETKNSHLRIMALLGSLRTSSEKPLSVVPKLADVFKGLFKARLNALLNYFSQKIFSTMETQLAEHKREIEFCQSRVQIIQDRIGKASNLLENQYLPQQNELENLLKIDLEVQTAIQEKYSALTQVCIGSEHLLGELEKTILEACDKFRNGTASKSSTMENEESANLLDHFKTLLQETSNLDNLVKNKNKGFHLAGIPKDYYGSLNLLNTETKNLDPVTIYPLNTKNITVIHMTPFENLTPVLNIFEDNTIRNHKNTEKAGNFFSRNDIPFEIQTGND